MSDCAAAATQIDVALVLLGNIYLARHANKLFSLAMGCSSIALGLFWRYA
jgi:hypothetical protein